MDSLDFLSSNEKDMLRDILESAKELKNSLVEPKQIREVVPVEKWIEDEYYVGKSGLCLYPYWKAEIIDIFGTNKGKYNELIVSGGIGTGKSTFALYCMLRRLYELSCYINIPALFHLMPNTLLSFIYFSVSKTQAELTGFGQFRSMIEEIPYFIEIFKKDPKIRSLLKFPENLLFIFGSSCLKGDTLIYTDKGVVRAEKLTTEHKVWDGSRYKPVEEIIKEENREFFKVKTSSGRWITTVGNHLHYTQRGFIKTLDLRPGDVLSKSIPDDPEVEPFKAPRGYESATFLEFIGFLSACSLKPILENKDGKTIGKIKVKHGCRTLAIKKYLKYFSLYIEIIDEETFLITGKLFQDLSFVESYKIPEVVFSLTKRDVLMYMNGVISAFGRGFKKGIKVKPKREQFFHELQVLQLYAGIDSEISDGYFRSGKTEEVIVSVEYDSIGTCYGAVVEGSVYTGGGLITHNTGHSIGMNMIGAILDEANFFQSGAQDPTKSAYEYSKISTMYSSIVNRGQSRFKSYGKDSSLCILVSSNTTASSFTEERIKKSQGKSNVKIINARLWDVKPKSAYSDKRFFVFVGNDVIDPFVVHSIDDIYQVTDTFNIDRVKGKSIEQVIDRLPKHIAEKFMKIPEDFRSSFEDDIIMSLQDIAGYSVAPSGRLFNSRQVYNNSISSFVKHPFTKESIIISTKDTVKVSDFVIPGFIPRERGKSRCLHIDQSVTTDSTGFASAFIYDYIFEDGIYKPVVCVDLQLRINPPRAPAKISISKVRDFIFFMKFNWGLNIEYVSYDWYASAESLQVLEENGIKSGHQSVDRTDDAYLTFVNMLYEGRIIWYGYKPSEMELFELIHYRDKGKVDHPDKGSKDVMDAVVGAVYNCVTKLEHTVSDFQRNVNEGGVLTGVSVSEAPGSDIFTDDDVLEGYNSGSF